MNTTAQSTSELATRLLRVLQLRDSEGLYSTTAELAVVLGEANRAVYDAAAAAERHGLIQWNEAPQWSKVPGGWSLTDAGRA